MSMPKDKPILDVNNMMQAVDKLCSVSLPIVDSTTADPARVESIRSYLNESVLSKGNEMTVGDAGMFAGVTIQSKQVTADQRTPQDIVTQGLVFFMAKDDQMRDGNGDLNPQSNGRRWAKFTELFGLDISELDHIRSDAGIGFIAPKVTSQPSQSAPDTAQRKAEKRKQATANRPNKIPKIGAATPQSQPHGGADRADLTAPAEPITFEAPVIGTAFLASGMQFVLYKPSEAYQKPERQSIIKNYFYADTITMLYGQAGSYKTFYAIWEGISLVLGKTLCGMEIEPETAPQKVLYISLEMSAKDISDRLTRMTRDLPEIERQQVENNFAIISAEDTANMKASNDSFISALEQLCTSEGYNVIYLDSFADYTAGLDVRSEGDMTSVIDALRTFTLKNHVSFRIIHHGTKPTQDANGSMAGIHTIRDLVDNVYLIKATDTKEVTVTSDMQKDRSAKSRHGEPITLLLQFVSDAESFSFKRINETETTSHIEKMRNLLRAIEEEQGISAGDLRTKLGNPKDFPKLIDIAVKAGDVIIDTRPSDRGSSKKCHFTADYWNNNHNSD